MQPEFKQVQHSATLSLNLSGRREWPVRWKEARCVQEITGMASRKERAIGTDGTQSVYGRPWGQSQY